MILLNIILTAAPILMVFMVMQAQINDLNEKLEKMRRFLNQNAN